MIITEHNQHFMVLLKEIVGPYSPAVTRDEAGLLLDSHAGIGFVGSSTPLEDMAERIGNTVWNHLLETGWGCADQTLQDVVDRYDNRDGWGAEITDDPRVKFVDRLRGLSPLEAVALHLAIYEWWTARHRAGRDADESNTPLLALERYFIIQS